MSTLILTRYRPFSNGSQFMDWESRNCGRCKKYDYDEETSSSTCPIAEAIADHACGEDLSKEMATRMGYLNTRGDKEQQNYNWDCRERVIGKPEPKRPPAPLPVDQQLRLLGAVTLPGFEGV